MIATKIKTEPTRLYDKLTERTYGKTIKNATKKSDVTSRCPTKRVYICSPFTGNVERNQAKARLYCRFAFEQGFVPIAPHLYYPQFLSDDDKDERAAGLRYGLESLWQCRELWAFGTYITNGMRAEIELAKDLKILVRYLDSDMEEIT
jgi:hypothetical protein